MANGRCRIHGGLSTGPKTAVGRERCRMTQWKHGRYSIIDKQRQGSGHPANLDFQSNNQSSATVIVEPSVIVADASAPVEVQQQASEQAGRYTADFLARLTPDAMVA